MPFPLRAARATHTTVLAIATVLSFAGCIERPLKCVQTHLQSSISQEAVNPGVDQLDLLVMVDNSGSMRDNQANVMRQFGLMIDTLVHPPCVSPSNPVPHACNPGDSSDVPQYPPVSDMHVGIVSSDLGTPGSNVPGCADADNGDDGRLNPIRNGAALQQHEPFMFASTFGRPTDCNDPNEFPSFIEFSSGTTDPTQFVHDFQCNAGLYVGGCGLESQLEAVYRALLVHDPRARAGNDDSNAGFLRDDALLAIVELTDEEDGSVRDDARDVYNAASTAYSNANLNLRFYDYQPCGPRDPTWRLERYIDPHDPSAGFLGLKPSHPERVVFAAITGVPLSGWQNSDGSTNWDALLGAPGPAGPDDFCGRDASQSIDMMSAEGPISMHQANPDPNCQDRVVPACRRAGTPFSPTACTTDQQYFAWPSRRIVEVARRFDQAPLCNGAPCHNGLVTSICSDDYAAAMREIVAKIQSRFATPCLPHVLATTTDPDGHNTVQCVVREVLPPDAPDACDASHGRSDPQGTDGVPTPTYVTDASGRHRVCDVAQVATDAATGAPVDPNAHGWFYDTRPQGTNQCSQTITFMPNDEPGSGSAARLECIQSITGGSNETDTSC